jgi:hypothetical protein
MNNKLKKFIPHIAAIVLFVGLSLVYFYPVVTENKTLFQGDLSNMTGWGKDLSDYHAETGDYAFWSNSMFSGMPANYTFMPSVFNIFGYISDIFRLNLSYSHIGILFIYMFGFYIFLLSIGCKPLLSIVGAIAYAFASYNLIIIAVGHVNKGLVMATMAPILGGIILCYRKKYLTGSFITLIFTGIHAISSHHQISYYLLLVIIVLAIVYLIYAIKKHTLKEYFKSSAFLLIAASIAIAPELGNLISTAEYAKDTMRGGSELKRNEETEKNSGLDIDYAYAWSYGKSETMNLLIPNFYGASSHYNIGENSECYSVLRPTGQAKQFCQHAPMYWGKQPFTDGPSYIGAIVCFLFVLGLFLVKGPEKWWLLGATILAIVLAWGKHFETVNNFLFYHLPLYNKFRVPAMALIITEVTMATMAILALKEIFDNKGDRKIYLKPVYVSVGITGGLCLLFALFGGSLMSFSGLSDAQYQNYPDLLNAIVADRKSLLLSDSWRSFIFIALVAGLLWCYINKKFRNAVYPVAMIGILILIDLWSVDKRFLNYDNFVDKKKTSEVIPTEIDKEILKDKDPNYRVLNLTSSTFQESKTSYFHKSIGGYSPVKLSRYQDIIDYYFAGSINPNIINMLNTKYIIFPTQQGSQTQINRAALGNAWFVNDLQWANSPNEEIEALKDFDPAQTAFIDKEWQSKLEGWESLQHGEDSAAFIRLTNYANPGNLFYESNSTMPHMAVFSEVFYKTWHAYIDGEEAPLVRVNYILRGLKVPAGNHKIEFKCIDDVFLQNAKFSKISSIIVGVIILCLLGLIIQRYLKNKSALPEIE